MNKINKEAKIYYDKAPSLEERNLNNDPLKVLKVGTCLYSE